MLKIAIKQNNITHYAAIKTFIYFFATTIIDIKVTKLNINH